MKTQNALLSLGLVLVALVRPLAAQDTKPGVTAKSHTAPEPAQGKIWKSVNTSHEYLVRIEPDRLYAEWVNIPPERRKQGAYIRSECRRTGDKWVGTTRAFMIFEEPGPNNAKTLKGCQLTLRFEIDSITPNQITGAGDTLHDFDIDKCQVKQTGWGKFVWVPKEMASSAAKKAPAKK